MKIILNNASMIPIYEQICDQIKNAVVNDELKAGEALPSVRSLAAELKISALTVKKSYDSLEKEGVIVTVHGKGSYISERNGDMILEARQHEIEQLLGAAIDKAKKSGMDAEEIRQLVEILLEG